MNKAVSVRAANVLFLVSILLVITLGSIVQMLDLSIGLIVTELLLILLPAVLLLRWRNIPLKEGLRLNPIQPVVGVLCVLLGVSAFLFSAFMDVVMVQLTGMNSVPLPEGSLPQGVIDSILFFIALAFAAPICEEALFRGVIQGAYEKQHTAFAAILLGGLMFAFYHMRLTGLPELLPVSFMLGYVAWRTRSIYASILVHFGMNGISAANSLWAIHVNGTGLPIISPGLALVGVVASAVILYGIIRLQARPDRPLTLEKAAGIQPEAREQPEAKEQPEAAKQPAWLATYWPLLAGGLIYLIVAGLTLASSLFPGLLGMAELHYNPQRIDAPVESRYQVTNRAGDVVGEMTCVITPENDQFSLDCVREIKGYQIQTPTGFFADGDHTAEWKARWDAQSLQLVDFSWQRKDTAGHNFDVVLQDGALSATDSTRTDVAQLAEDSWIEYEWAWRANTLEPEGGSLWQTSFGYLQLWDEREKDSTPTVKNEIVQITQVDGLQLPAGTFDAWKVSVGGQAAWYGKNDSGYPRPIQFDDGMVLYSLLN